MAARCAPAGSATPVRRAQLGNEARQLAVWQVIDAGRGYGRACLFATVHATDADIISSLLSTSNLRIDP